MKTCPSCQTRYTDDTLRFCLQDGAPLDMVPATQQPTVSLAGQEVETVARANIPTRDSEVTQWKPKSEITHVSSLQPPASGSKTALVIAAVAMVILLLFGVAGVGTWLYLKGRGGDVVRNANNGNGNQSPFPPRNINSSGLITPGPTAAPSPAPTATAANNNSPVWIITPTPTPQIDKQQVSRDISQQIYDWKSLAESGDLNSYMRKYAATVDYYRKSGASVDFVRRDKQRAFTMFSSMSVTISNMNVSVGVAGDSATAVFDKEWVFDGRRRSTGKVQQQMRFRKINGEWLITGERDLKVYYTN